MRFFYIAVFLVAMTVLLLFIAEVIYVRQPERKGKTFLRLAGVVFLIMAGTAWYNGYGMQLPTDALRGVGRLWGTESYAVLIGAVLGIILLLPFAILRFITEWQAKKAARAVANKKTGLEEKGLEGEQEELQASVEDGLGEPVPAKVPTKEATTVLASSDVDLGARYMSRRSFLKHVGALIPAATMASTTAMAVDGTMRVQAEHLKLTYQNLPSSLEGYKLAQISDVHLGPYFDMAEFRKMMETINREKVDRVVITGDLIDGLHYLPQLCEALTEWFGQIPEGIDYIIGNHEHMRGLPQILRAFETTPMRVLVNDAILMKAGSSGEAPVYLAGVDYVFGRDPVKTAQKRQAYLEEALRKVPTDAFTILLAHHPDFIPDAFARHIPLTLSGHTHGGQLNILGMSLVPVGTPYWKGMYTEGELRGYVSRGTGHWFPLRFNCPREITYITFHKG